MRYERASLISVEDGFFEGAAGRSESLSERGIRRVEAGPEQDTSRFSDCERTDDLLLVQTGIQAKLFQITWVIP